MQHHRYAWPNPSYKLGQPWDKICIRYFDVYILMSLLSSLSLNKNINKEMKRSFTFLFFIGVFSGNLGHRAIRNFIQLYLIDGYGTQYRTDRTAKGNYET